MVKLRSGYKVFLEALMDADRPEASMVSVSQRFLEEKVRKTSYMLRVYYFIFFFLNVFQKLVFDLNLILNREG